MSANFKKIFTLGVITAVSCLYGETEALSDSKEVSMSTVNDGCSRCCPESCDEESRIRPWVKEEDCDYDIYTVGSDEEQERCERKSCCEKRKSNCDNECKRKGAAKVAQE